MATELEVQQQPSCGLEGDSGSIIVDSRSDESVPDEEVCDGDQEELEDDYEEFDKDSQPVRNELTPSVKSRGGRSQLIPCSEDPLGRIERGRHFFSYLDEHGAETTPLPTDKPDETNPRPLECAETETMNGNIAKGVASEFEGETSRNSSPDR